MAKWFGTDGIRGIANADPVTPEMGLKLGQAVVAFCKKKGCVPDILIGRDTRESGKMLEDAIVSGILQSGGTACRAGVIPTPGVAFLTRSMDGGAGIVVSASHNPYEYNGFKIFSGDGFKLSEKDEAEIEELIQQLPDGASDGEPGHDRLLDNAGELYNGFLKKSIPDGFRLEGMKIILDCGHGATHRVAPELFEDLGAQVEALFTTPDGRNINNNCGSQHTEALSGRVTETEADAGLAFDGDGDRIIVIDEKGNALTGDQVLAILAKMLKETGELKGHAVVSTVMSNMGLRMALEKIGVQLITAKVGDRNVMEAMRMKGANLGGEDSGHIIFLDHHTTGDGLVSALQVLKAMTFFDRSLSELSTLMSVFPQTLINVHVRIKPEISSVRELTTAIKKVEEALGSEGRVLVRYSGTEPVCRVMVEGERRHEIEKHARDLARIIEKNLT
ncbi:MAG: phosphoglucosamine mutase [Deltaproteobacteria bacterium]|nr:phosphoglucosamine mutase [Deltaproteobacteria bacterium]